MATPCATCGGMGVCPTCQGTGIEEFPWRDPVLCGSCGGQGHCAACSGSGEAPLVNPQDPTYT